MRIMKILLGTLFGFSLLALPVAAQTSGGSIRGTVADQSGAVVPGVEVQAENVATGILTTALSNDTGDFAFLNLPPGMYRLISEMSGFKRTESHEIPVNIGRTTRANITLELGEITDSVTVTGGAMVITPDTATAGTVVTDVEYEKLPLAAGSGRSRIVTDFALTTPGVIGGQQRPGTNLTATTSISVDGSTRLTTDILVDGMSSGQFQNFGSFTELSIPADAVGEFNLIKGIMPAEYGYSRTAVVSFSLKSGTNKLHGSLFENFRNEVLNARSFFEADKLPLRHNNFGGTVGGPVYIPSVYDGRDRTFFLFSGDISIFRGTSVVRVYTSPTVDFLNGDFSQLRTSGGDLRVIYDPATTRPDGQGGLTRDPFPGNIIPQDRIDPIARQVAALIPPPNRSGIDSNFVGRAGAARIDTRFFTTKLDHQLTDSHRLSGSFTYTRLPRHSYSNPYEGTPLLTGLNQDISSNSTKVQWDYTINSNTLTHLTAAYNRFHNRSASFSKGEGWPEKLGLAGVGGDGSMPVFRFSSDGYPKMGHERWDGNVEENFVVRDTTSLLRGNHSVKFGFEMRRQVFKTRRWRNQAGTFWFDFKGTALNASNQTGNSFASFLLGHVNEANISAPLHVASARPYYGFFVQDDIKVTPKLVLNLGLRYDLELAPREQYDRASTFDLDTPNPGAGNLPGAYIYAGTPENGGQRTFEDRHYGAVGPRLGIAYNLRPGTVIRAGYGINHSTHRLLNHHGGYSTTQSFISPDFGTNPAFLLKDGMPTDWVKPPFIDPTFGNGNNVSATIRNDSARMPRTQVWRLDLQQEVFGGTVFEAAYVGTRGTGLNAALRQLNQVDAQYLSLGSLLTADIYSEAAQEAGLEPPYEGFTGTVRQALRPYPQVLDVSTREDKLGSSMFHSAQFKLHRRFAAGFSYLVSYTYSKNMTDVPSGMAGISTTRIQDAGNRRAEWAIAPYDIPQNFWVSAIYDLPFGAGKRFALNGFMDALFGNWNVSVMLNYQSGIPLPIYQNNRLPLFNARQRPDRASGVEPRNDVGYGDYDPAVDRLFNPSAFQSPAPYTFGNAPPRLSDGRGFGTMKEDLALRKQIIIHEDIRFEINFQSFNLFNRNAWGSASSNHSSSSFGKVTSAGPGRNIQIGLKLLF